MDELLKYLTSFGVPQDHAEAIAYKLLPPTDMHEALTRVYQDKYGSRADGSDAADRHLSTTAYNKSLGIPNLGDMDAILKQAAAMIVKPTKADTSGSSVSDFRPRGQDLEADINDARNESKQEKLMSHPTLIPDSNEPRVTKGGRGYE